MPSASLLPHRRFGLRGRRVPPYLDSSQPIETRVEDLLSRMSVEEKIALVEAR